MSAESIARWNAIPLDRPEPNQTAQPLLKRARPEGDGDESEDNVSLVSRTPSPPPPDAMDIDKYDEYWANKTEREVVTVETKIKSTNVGFSMLAKMGWVEGSPLGLSGDGRVDPIPFYVKNDLTGLGKTSQDVRMIESTVSQRRELDSERQTKETDEQRRQREDEVARRAAVKSEISNALRPFYCEVCEKQFQNVAQYDEHTNSYAHHHKVRFRDMQAAQRASRNTEEEVSKRKEKERKREEKELRKIAKAAGIKMAKPSVAPSVALTESTASPPVVDDNKSSAFKKSGWASVSASTANVSINPTEPSKKLGWATVGEAQGTSGSGGGWAPVSTSPLPSSAPLPSNPSGATPESSRTKYATAPAFRTGGWTSLETSSGAALPLPPSLHVPPPSIPPHHAPPPPPAAIPNAPPPTPDEPRQGWANMSRQPGAGGWNAVAPTNGPPCGAPSPAAASSVRLPPVSAEPVRPEGSRSGWQKFRAGAPGRRR